jgi:integrase
MQNNEVDIKKITFKQGCDEWLTYKQNSVKESSYLNYKFKVEKHLKTDLGNKTLYELSKLDINEYVLNKKTKTNNKNIKELVILLKSIFKYLKKKYKIDFDLDFNAGPNEYLGEIEVFNEKERQKLLKYLIDSKEIKNLGILISLYSGLRIGEVCGLKWSDIDFENKLITVKRTVQRVYLGKKQTKVIITTPKTRKSIRKIPMSKILMDKLKNISKEYSKDAFIITR